MQTLPYEIVHNIPHYSATVDTISLAHFASFVQELVASPMDGVSLLLEVLRAIQLSQCGNATVAPHSTAAAVATMQRNNQTYQRRALLDELACL